MGAVDYGLCHCGHLFRAEFCDVQLKVDERSVVLTGVPHGMCGRCGVRVLKPEALERIESVLRAGQASGRPVMRP